MGASQSMPRTLVANTLEAARSEPDDQAGEGRGDQPGRRRTRRQRAAEKGRSRNLVIPDSLHDAAFIFARRTKVKTTWRRTVNGHVVSSKEGTRSLTISEVVCDALTAYLKSKGALDDGDKSAASE
jgi:hypothetical protein